MIELRLLRQHPSSRRSNDLTKRGFTLIELSIVMVIIGLLVGGIFTGRALIRQAELRALSTDITSFVTATYTFRAKYNGLPGDLPNATTFFGAANNDPTICLTTVTIDTQTCNGDGNSQINIGTNEMFRYWQQLASAGFIRGKYTGVAGSSNAYDTEAGVNAPAAKIPKVTFLVRWGGIFAGNASDFATYLGQFMAVGFEQEGVPQGKFLTPSELLAIDTKLDDGKPGRGKIIASYWDSCTNASSSSDLDTTYKNDDGTLACGMLNIDIF